MPRRATAATVVVVVPRRRARAHGRQRVRRVQRLGRLLGRRELVVGRAVAAETATATADRGRAADAGERVVTVEVVVVGSAGAAALGVLPEGPRERGAGRGGLGGVEVPAQPVHAVAAEDAEDVALLLVELCGESVSFVQGVGEGGLKGRANLRVLLGRIV